MAATKRKGRTVVQERRPWTLVDLQLLRAHFADSRTQDIADALGCSYGRVAQKANALGFFKSEAYMASKAACRLRQGEHIGKTTQFKSGQQPWNKGVKGVVGVQPACKASQFKPGNRPATWVPVGSYRINCDGVLYRKVSDQPGPSNLRWHPVHRLVWEAANGPVPAGFICVFKPGRRTAELDNITLDAVEIITRADNMRRSSYHNYGPELAQLVQLRGALTRQINKLTTEGHDDHTQQQQQQ